MNRKLGLLAAIAVFVTLVLTAQGCNSGCIDKFDCSGSGEWSCVNGACVAVPDAGT